MSKKKKKKYKLFKKKVRVTIIIEEISDDGSKLEQNGLEEQK